MNAKIYDVTVVRLDPGRPSRKPKTFTAIRRRYRMLLIDCNPANVSAEIAKQIPDGWRIEHVSNDDTVIGAASFILSVTEEIP